MQRYHLTNKTGLHILPGFLLSWWYKASHAFIILYLKKKKNSTFRAGSFTLHPFSTNPVSATVCLNDLIHNQCHILTSYTYTQTTQQHTNYNTHTHTGEMFGHIQTIMQTMYKQFHADSIPDCGNAQWE